MTCDYVDFPHLFLFLTQSRKSPAHHLTRSIARQRCPRALGSLWAVFMTPCIGLNRVNTADLLLSPALVRMYGLRLPVAL
jgi:hypothetical protein